MSPSCLLLGGSTGPGEPGVSLSSCPAWIPRCSRSSTPCSSAWTFAHTEERLAEIIRDVHERCATAAEEYGSPGNYVVGANISSFIQVADAMLALGVI
ncbi:MAG TPA: hypothetical protein VFD59_05195 [Nocardioidaceae bacterium]|nr:hypothetical protein [Nocardioidaceae bacterium]